MKSKIESFDMNKIPEGLDKHFLVKIVAKSVGITDHTKDPTIPVEDRVKRLYTKEELVAGARTLSMRPININHKDPINGAFVVFSQMNAEDKLESLCYIPDEGYLNKIKEEIIKNVSIEQVNFDEVETMDGLKLEDIVFTGLALVEPPAIAGDKSTSIIPLYEGMNILCEIEGVETLKTKDETIIVDDQTPVEPVAPVVPVIVEPVIVEPVVVEPVVVEPEPVIVEPVVVEPEVVEPEVDKDALIAEQAARILELEAAVTKLTTSVETIKSAQTEKITEAVGEFKREIVDKIDNELPKIFIVGQRGANQAHMLARNVRRVLKEVSGE